MSYTTENYDQSNDYNTTTFSFEAKTLGIDQITASTNFSSGNLSNATARSIRLYKGGIQINGELVAANMVGAETYEVVDPPTNKRCAFEALKVSN